MGKEKIIEKTGEEIINKSSMILQYAPLIIALATLVICYFLYKKIQTNTFEKSSIENLEKKIAGSFKEQTELNNINDKKFNALMSQINQVSYILQNNNSRDTNTIDTQMSPERETPDSSNSKKQQPQRELMPTSVIQTNFPINMEHNVLPTPIITTNKKENLNKKEMDKSLNKKVIDLQKTNDKILIDEVTSDDE